MKSRKRCIPETERLEARRAAFGAPTELIERKAIRFAVGAAMPIQTSFFYIEQAPEGGTAPREAARFRAVASALSPGQAPIHVAGGAAALVLSTEGPARRAVVLSSERNG